MLSKLGVGFVLASVAFASPLRATAQDEFARGHAEGMAAADAQVGLSALELLGLGVSGAALGVITMENASGRGATVAHITVSVSSLAGLILGVGGANQPPTPGDDLIQGLPTGQGYRDGYSQGFRSGARSTLRFNAIIESVVLLAAYGTAAALASR